jgi:hypothetical protein
VWRDALPRSAQFQHRIELVFGDCRRLESPVVWRKITEFAIGVDGRPDSDGLHSRKHNGEVLFSAFDVFLVDGEDVDVIGDPSMRQSREASGVHDTRSGTTLWGAIMVNAAN